MSPIASLALAFDILAKDKTGAAFDSASRSADGFSKKLSNVGTIAKTAIAGTAIGAIAGLGTAMVGGLKDAVAYETLQKKTTAVLKSTGNAANTSVKGIQNLAGKLESLSGVDEELIINSQNVLATFTKVRNEAGKGNDIFDKATASSLDLSVALGTDLQSATTMVGKALNDPIAGLTAMSKAGIQFTDDQKNLIRTLVESGDVLGAQKIILGELETQFGGTAKAAGSGLAGDMARLKDAFQDAFRELGTALLPTLTSFASWLSDALPVAIQAGRDALGTLKAWWDDNGPAIMAVVNDLKEGVLDAFDKVIEAGKFVIDHWDQFKYVAGVMAALIINHYVRMAAAATASAATQVAAWVRVEAQAARSSIAIAASAVKALGPLGLVIAAAEELNNIVGHKEGDPNADKSILERLDPRSAFDGLELDIPFFADGGVMPGPRGVHSLAMVAGGETILPTHKTGGSDAGFDIEVASSSGFDAVGEDQLMVLREQNGLLAALLNAVSNASGTFTQSRATMAVMG